MTTNRRNQHAAIALFLALCAWAGLALSLFWGLGHPVDEANLDAARETHRHVLLWMLGSSGATDLAAIALGILGLRRPGRKWPAVTALLLAAVWLGLVGVFILVAQGG